MNPTLLAADADEATKSNLLYTVVWELSKVKDAIATDYVSAKYYTTQTTIVTGGGKGFSVLARAVQGGGLRRDGCVPSMRSSLPGCGKWSGRYDRNRRRWKMRLMIAALLLVSLAATAGASYYTDSGKGMVVVSEGA